MKQREYRNRSWNHFIKNKSSLISLWLLGIYGLLALLAPVIANDQPLYASYQGKSYYPAFDRYRLIHPDLHASASRSIPSYQIDWNSLATDHMVWPIIRFAPGKSDPTNPDYQPPSYHHWLGTTKNGSDVFSGLVYGARISLTIGILSMLIASIIGLFLGAIAGYFGDHRVSMPRRQAWFMLAGLLPAYFYSFAIHDSSPANQNWLLSNLLDAGIFIFILFLFGFTGYKISGPRGRQRRVHIHCDSLVSRTMEVFTSIPRLVLIITIASITRPSYLNIVMIIGLTSWTEIARFVRAELLRTRHSEFIQTAQAMGLTHARILRKHALPNALAPASVAIAFGIASAILIESGLSFLGIGVPLDSVTWGTLLFGGKENFDAWWLVVFPGLAIFTTVTAFNLVGDGLRDAMDVKSRIHYASS